MGFFDFFKRKKKVKERKAETNNTNDSESIIKIKQKLFAKNGDIVTICDINEKTITVEYKHKKYKRDKSVIGKTLFVSKPLKSSLITQETQIDDQDSQEKLKLKQEQEIERIRLERAEIYRKQEEERKFQKQLEQQRKEEERQRQEKLELYRKQEERKRQAQLSLRRKKDAERRVQEKIELEKKKKEEQKLKQEQLLLEKTKEIELLANFKRNVTPLYHDVYGEGVFVEFDPTNKYIDVKFNSQSETTTFSYPDAMGEHLFVKKTKKLLNREKLFKNHENNQEYIEEQQHFIKVCKTVDENLKGAIQENSLIKHGYNDFSDSYDSLIYKNHQAAIKNLYLWREIRRNPYFARVDYGKNLKLYIGKNPIDNLVIDWRDKICNLYYHYNIYIGNEEKNLSLVRDFDITSGIYCGFNDKYSRKDEYIVNGIEDKRTSDRFLIKVINENRSDKKVHDIIQTIQKNQYEIITYDKMKDMLVLGCAGSGKTMIMLHRLSYIMFNTKNLDVNNIHIISPTQLLNIENNELSQMLDINSVNRMDTEKFNVNLINKYYKQNKVLNHFDFKDIISNTFISNDLIKLFYSDNFIKSFKEDINAIVLSDSKKRMSFIELEDSRILNEYMSFSEKNLIFTSISDAYAKNISLNNIYENIKKVVLKVPLENAIEKVKNLTKQINSKNINNSTLKNKKEVLENLINDWDLSENTIYTNKNNRDETSVSDEIFTEVFAYFNVLASKNNQNKNILNEFSYLRDSYDSVLQLFNNYKLVAEKINRFKDFVNKSSYDYLSEIIGQLILDIKKDNKIDCNITYEFEIFLHLVAFNSIFNNLHDKPTLLFIDEFQDYAATEISLYKQIFPNAIFNMFGDIKQSINPKGLNENQIKQVIENNCKIFNINENYRNAHQITEFINSKFGIAMMPIGIDGSVKHCDIRDVSSEIQLDYTDRVAFIIKDNKLYEKIKMKYIFNDFEKINVITNDECEVKRGFLNIIPINLAKGLEFEKVYVIPNNMTQNEKYVAFTRALNELCIISISDIISNKFIIEKNNFLKRNTVGYYHQIYTGFKKPGNPDFLNTLKNTFDSESHKNLIEARDKVIEILIDDIPKIISEQSMSNSMIVCVPRAKALKSFSKSQLMLKEAVKISANNICGTIDGTDCIKRVVNTRTTHLSKASRIYNDGDKPYPGIIIDTCELDKGKIMNQNIILIDDIYTKNVNIDEDCIQALLDIGANKVMFYSIGYTRRL